MEYAGFQQCVAQLTNYMQKIPGAQRARPDGPRPPPDLGLRTAEGEADNHPASVCASERKDDCPLALFPAHSPFQPLCCSSPTHEHAFTPPAPWLSPSFSTFVSSPSFLSSPLSADTSVFCVSPTAPHFGPPLFSWPAASTLHPTPREGSPPTSPPLMWRPWF